MANFEQLIRSAIDAKQAVSPQARALVYASSRNALQKIIARNPSLTAEAAALQEQQLEAVIERIENEHLGAAQSVTTQSIPITENQTGAATRVSGHGEPTNETATIAAAAQPAAAQPAAAPEPVPTATEPPVNATLPQQVRGSAGFSDASTADQFVSSATEPQSSSKAATTVYPPSSEPLSARSAAEHQAKDDPMAELEQILSGGRSPAARPPATSEAVYQPQQQTQTRSPDTVSVAENSAIPVVHAEQQTPSAPVADHHPLDGTEQEASPADVPAMRTESQGKGLPPEFTRRRKSQRRFVWILVVLLCLGVLALVAYRIFSDFFDSYIANNGSGSVVISDNASRKDSNSDYINILEPGDLTALSVTDNGKVEIVNEQSNDMIRLMSVRDKNDFAIPANPILLRLKPGVIEQVRGKRVTVEIYARSGSGGASQFTVECKFENSIGCGRKRFRVGAQPEASIFAFTMEESQPIDGSALIAINTDITPAASVVGKGDVLDIVYVRLRTFKDG